MRIKRILYFLAATISLLFFTLSAQGAGRPFITRWFGVEGEPISLPIVGKNYKLVIKKVCGAKIKEVVISVTDPAKAYKFIPQETGEYRVEAGPEGVEYIAMSGNPSSADRLLYVEKFGTVQWTTMKGAFSDCYHVQFAHDIDIPDFSNVEDMSNMFAGCNSFTADLSKWDVSGVKNMSSLFNGCSSFNSDLSRWNVGNVKDMRMMFAACFAFNSDLSRWNVGNVTDMTAMFMECQSFKSDLSRWDVRNVRKMSEMFFNCFKFDSDLSRWDVRNVESMSLMFFSCVNFSASLSNWDVSNVKDMRLMFFNCWGISPGVRNWKFHPKVRKEGIFL